MTTTEASTLPNLDPYTILNLFPATTCCIAEIISSKGVSKVSLNFLRTAWSAIVKVGFWLAGNSYSAGIFENPPNNGGDPGAVAQEVNGTKVKIIVTAKTKLKVNRDWLAI